MATERLRAKRIRLLKLSILMFAVYAGFSNVEKIASYLIRTLINLKYSLMSKLVTEKRKNLFHGLF
jgi:hypothetical protein